MELLKLFFWVLLFIICYTYVGYGIVLFAIIKIKRFLKIGGTKKINYRYEPEVTLFITAYNEKAYVSEKMKNTLELDYPKDKLKIVWVTDGSNDGTPKMVNAYDNVKLYHSD